MSETTQGLASLSLPLRLGATVSRYLPRSLKSLIYRIPVLAPLVRKSLNLAAPAVHSWVQVSSGPIAGLQLKLDLRREKYYWLGTYEPEMIDVLHDVVSPGMVVYDVGASLGYMTLFLAKLVGERGHVFAFEPLPENLERLRVHVDKNGFGGRVTVCPLAVSGSCGTAEFRKHGIHSMGRLSSAADQAEGFTSTISVETVSLDAFVYEQRHPAPDIVKMDIEGAETKALPSMTWLLREIRPLVLLESHAAEGGRTALSVFQQAGYEVFRVEAGLPRIDSAHVLGAKDYLLAERPAEVYPGPRPRGLSSVRNRGRAKREVTV